MRCTRAIVAEHRDPKIDVVRRKKAVPVKCTILVPRSGFFVEGRFEYRVIKQEPAIRSEYLLCNV
jgi:hypothetical protein